MIFTVYSNVISATCAYFIAKEAANEEMPYCSFHPNLLVTFSFAGS